jgi:hypothetical protein
MSHIQVIMINTDQGLILNASTIYAAFSRKANVVLIKNPWTLGSFPFPDGFTNYNIIEGLLPSVSLDVMPQPEDYNSFDTFKAVTRVPKKYILSVFSMDSQRFYYYKKDAPTKVCTDSFLATELFPHEIYQAIQDVPGYAKYNPLEIKPEAIEVLEAHRLM